METQNDILNNLTPLQKKYLEYLGNISKEDESVLFTNSGKEHAEVLMYKIFEKTSNEINIYARGLKPELTSSKIYMEGLRLLASKDGVMINVLVETDEYKNDPSSALNFLLSQDNNNIKFRLLKGESIKSLQNLFIGYEHCNFCVADNKMFRYEINPDKFEAIGSFNNPDLSNKFKAIFDKFFIDEHSVQFN